MTEPHTIINGMELTDAQAMAVRVAVTSFYQEMGEKNALGDDEVGRKLASGYRDRLMEGLKLMAETPT